MAIGKVSENTLAMRASGLLKDRAYVELERESRPEAVWSPPTLWQDSPYSFDNCYS